MRYTLRQLEIFVAAAGDGNFARAAARLGVSQPAVSDHIRALERNLGAELFVRRRGSTAVLTEAGERLRQEAEAVLEQGARLDERAAAAGREVSLRIYAGPHIADRLLRPALPAFHRDHPGITLKITSETAPGAVDEMLQRRELDLAVFTAGAAFLPADAEVLADIACVVVASRRLVGERALEASEIGRLPFVLPLEGAAGTRWVEAALQSLGIRPSNVAARTQYLDVQLKMVEAGEACALLFQEAVEASPARGELRRLGPEIAGLKRAMATRRGDDRPELKIVADFVRGAIRQGALGLPSTVAPA